MIVGSSQACSAVSRRMRPPGWIQDFFRKRWDRIGQRTDELRPIQGLHPGAKILLKLRQRLTPDQNSNPRKLGDVGEKRNGWCNTTRRRPVSYHAYRIAKVVEKPR